MTTPTNITGIAYKIDVPTRKYITKRLSQIDRYLPRQVRKSVSADVKLRQINHDNGDKYQVEIKLNLPGKTIVAKDSSSHILAAVDIVEAKVYSQLRRYKSESKKDRPRGVMAWIKYSLRRPEAK